MTPKNILTKTFYFTIFLATFNLTVSKNIYTMEQNFNQALKKSQKIEEFIKKYELSKTEIVDLLLSIIREPKERLFTDIDTHRKFFFDSLSKEDTVKLLEKKRSEIERSLNVEALFELEKKYILKFLRRRTQITKKDILNLIDIKFLSEKNITTEMLFDAGQDFLLSQLAEIRYEKDRPEREKITLRGLQAWEEGQRQKNSSEKESESKKESEKESATPEEPAFKSLSERFAIEEATGGFQDAHSQNIQSVMSSTPKVKAKKKKSKQSSNKESDGSSHSGGSGDSSDSDGESSDSEPFFEFKMD